MWERACSRKRSYQSAHMSTDTTPSRAGSLPQGLVDCSGNCPALEQQGQPQPVTDNNAALKKIHEYPRFNATAPINGPAIASARSKNTAYALKPGATAGTGHLLDRLDAQRRIHQRQAKPRQPRADQGERRWRAPATASPGPGFRWSCRRWPSVKPPKRLIAEINSRRDRMKHTPNTVRQYAAPVQPRLR